jgi:hypothetical protein
MEAIMAIQYWDRHFDLSRTVGYAPAPAGSGKSHEAANVAKARAARGELVVWAAPTKDVIDELVRRHFASESSCPEYFVFHGGTAGEHNVVREIVRHFKDAPEEGHIVFITHSAFRLVPYWGERTKSLILDETPGGCVAPSPPDS